MILFGILMLVLWSVAAHGRTWTVRKDGSGDFTVIQRAVEAASDGDVIDIGPGRFDDYETIWLDGVPVEDAYVYLDGISLTLQGAGADQTVIGPEDEDFHPWPGRDVFIVHARNTSGFSIYDMTLEHSPWKIVSAYYNTGSYHMSGCTIREGNSGLDLACPDGGGVEDCHFEDMDNYGVHTTNPTTFFFVRNCTFSNVFAPAAADWSPSHLVVSDCQMEGGRVGVSFSGGASGSVTNCIIRGFDNYGVAMNDPGAVTVTGNVIEQTNGWGMFIGDADQAEITGNIIRTETGTCLNFPYPNDGMVFEGNDLFRGQGNFAQTNDYWPYTPATYLHVENNYWGTTDAAEIQAHMIDGHVQDQVNMFVVFEPFAGGPVPVEQRSLSEVKGLFR